MSAVALPAPFETPPGLIRLPRWARPWERTLDDEVVAAVGVDSRGNFANAPSATTPGAQTKAFTNTAGGLVVGMIGMGVNGGGTTSLNAMSYGGSAMTKYTERTVTAGGSDSRIVVFYLLSAPTGANNFTFTPSMTSGLNFNLWGAFISFTGHDTTTPLTNAAAASSNGVSGTTGTVTTASAVAATSRFVGIVGMGAGNTWTGFTPTSFFSTGDGSTQLGAATAGDSAGSGSTMTTTGTWVGSDSWIALAFEVAAAGAAPKSLVADTRRVARNVLIRL